MVTVLALAAALLYGSADFLGGAAARRAPLLSVLVLSSVAGMIVTLTATLVDGAAPRAAGLGWGICAGAAGGAGLLIFYGGLAAGPMSVVAPLSALASTVLPVAVALAEGERPGALVYTGALLCIAAIVLVSSGSSATQGRDQYQDQGADRDPHQDAGAGRRRAGRAIVTGLASGTAFGLFFLFIRNGSESGALWPVAAARMAGGAVIFAVAGARARAVRWRASTWALGAALAAGALDSSANICYAFATRAGLFGLAVVLTALYPGVTVLLARILLGERIGRLQGAGLALAAAGIVLVTV
jgi:drug/metabolite transporter (DMT)-like permease